MVFVFDYCFICSFDFCKFTFIFFSCIGWHNCEVFCGCCRRCVLVLRFCNRNFFEFNSRDSSVVVVVAVIFRFRLYLFNFFSCNNWDSYVVFGLLEGIACNFCFQWYLFFFLPLCFSATATFLVVTAQTAFDQILRSFISGKTVQTALSFFVVVFEGVVAIFHFTCLFVSVVTAKTALVVCYPVKSVETIFTFQ